jgi:gas vesicle protein
MARDKELEILEEEVEVYESDGASGIIGFIGGLLLGTLIGAGVALLVAPERGDVTRRRLRTKIRDAGDEAKEHLEDWRDDAERELRRHRRKLQRRLRSRPT